MSHDDRLCVSVAFVVSHMLQIICVISKGQDLGQTKDWGDHSFHATFICARIMHLPNDRKWSVNEENVSSPTLNPTIGVKLGSCIDEDPFDSNRNAYATPGHKFKPDQHIAEKISSNMPHKMEETTIKAKVAVLGMSPALITDVLRLKELRKIHGESFEIISVSEHPSEDLHPSRGMHVTTDFSTARGWNCLLEAFFKVILLDYSWFQRDYFYTNYGGKSWFTVSAGNGTSTRTPDSALKNVQALSGGSTPRSTTSSPRKTSCGFIQRFFEWDGLLVILPLDERGDVWREFHYYQSINKYQYQLIHHMRHPLVHATIYAENSIDWQKLVPREFQCKTDDNQHRYLRQHEDCATHLAIYADSDAGRRALQEYFLAVPTIPSCLLKPELPVSQGKDNDVSLSSDKGGDANPPTSSETSQNERPSSYVEVLSGTKRIYSSVISNDIYTYATNQLMQVDTALKDSAIHDNSNSTKKRKISSTRMNNCKTDVPTEEPQITQEVVDWIQCDRCARWHVLDKQLTNNDNVFNLSKLVVFYCEMLDPKLQCM